MSSNRSSQGNQIQKDQKVTTLTVTTEDGERNTVTNVKLQLGERQTEMIVDNFLITATRLVTEAPAPVPAPVPVQQEVQNPRQQWGPMQFTQALVESIARVQQLSNDLAREIAEARVLANGAFPGSIAMVDAVIAAANFGQYVPAPAPQVQPVQVAQPAPQAPPAQPAQPAPVAMPVQAVDPLAAIVPAPVQPAEQAQDNAQQPAV